MQYDLVYNFLAINLACIHTTWYFHITHDSISDRKTVFISSPLQSQPSRPYLCHQSIAHHRKCFAVRYAYHPRVSDPYPPNIQQMYYCELSSQIRDDHVAGDVCYRARLQPLKNL